MTALAGARGHAPLRDGRHHDSGPGTTRPLLRARLAALTGAFGLETQQAAIEGSFDAIFRQAALDFPPGRQPPQPSRLTEDGTPLQFATVVGLPGAFLRFVGDPAPPEGTGGARLRASITAMEDLAGVLGLMPELASLGSLPATLAPQGDPLLLADPAGALWLGAAFATSCAPRMRVYFNGGWGGPAQRIARLRGFAAHFGQAEAWHGIEGCLPPALEPLGLAVTLAPGRGAHGALYFRAFGLRLGDYVALARNAGGAANAARIDAFGLALLGEEARHPAGSAVLSFGFGPVGGVTVDLEFCAHCLFRTDAEARKRLLQMFEGAGVDPRPYLLMADGLRSGAGQTRPPRIHSFIGIDGKSATPVFSLYMKPDLARPG